MPCCHGLETFGEKTGEFFEKFPDAYIHANQFVKEYNELSCLDRRRIFNKTVGLPIRSFLPDVVSTRNQRSRVNPTQGTYAEVIGPWVWNGYCLECEHCIDSSLAHEEPTPVLLRPPPPRGLDPYKYCCSQECVMNYKARTSGYHARLQLFSIDKGKCRQCGIDTVQLFRQLRDVSFDERISILARTAGFNELSSKELVHIASKLARDCLWEVGRRALL